MRSDLFYNRKVHRSLILYKNSLLNNAQNFYAIFYKKNFIKLSVNIETATLQIFFKVFTTTFFTIDKL